MQVPSQLAVEIDGVKQIQVVRTEGVVALMQVRKWSWIAVRTLVRREDLFVLVQEDRAENIRTILQHRQNLLCRPDVTKGHRSNTVATNQGGNSPEPLDHLVPLPEGVVGSDHPKGYQEEQTARAGNADAQLRPDREVAKALHQVPDPLLVRELIGAIVTLARPSLRRRRSWPPGEAVS